jgi:hypothetical protein
MLDTATGLEMPREYRFAEEACRGMYLACGDDFRF